MSKLYQQITDICFEESTVTKPMVDRLQELFKQNMLELIGENEEPEYGIARVGNQAEVIGNISAVRNAIRTELRKKVNEL